MDRMKLGLFGAARPSTAAHAGSSDLMNAANAANAETRERMRGLTPIEIAAVEAMSQRNMAALSAR